MKRTIFLKLFGGYALILLLAAGLIFLLSSASVRRSHEASAARNLEALGRALQPDVDALLDSGRTADLDAFVKQTEKRAGARITLVAPRARTVRQACAVSFASAGRTTDRLGIARSAERCSIGWCVGPSSPRPIESCVQT